MANQRARAQLQQLKRDLGAMSEELRRSVKSGLEWFSEVGIRDHFTRGRQRDVIRQFGWPRLSPRTLANRPGGRPILNIHGFGRANSLAGSVVRNNKITVQRRSLKGKIKFSAVFYARYHRLGLGNVPRRVWQNPTRRDQRRIDKEIERDLRKRVRRRQRRQRSK